MSTKRYLTADEVVAALAISKATLYSYVSRGLIRSEETGDKPRAKRYWAEDVETLKQRKEQRRNPAQAAAAALHWGDPVLESAITLIVDGQCYYRGQRVIDLARDYHFEQVAALLWRGDFAGHTLFAEPLPTAIAIMHHLSASHPLTLGAPAQPATQPSATPAEAFQMALLTAAPLDLAAYHHEAPAVMRTGVRILQVLTQVVAPSERAGRIAERLQRTWRPAEPDVAALLDSVLILCADHELNISSFTARCVASAGATPYGAVLAALAALQGYKHGGVGERVAAFLDTATPDPHYAVRACLRRGEPIPGFGHHLYPAGDPRGKLLLELAHVARPAAPVLAVADAIIETTATATQLAPNLDFGLVTLARALALPAHASFTLFALGRTAGWVGHVLEQYALNQLIRPRSRYIGVPPLV